MRDGNLRDGTVIKIDSGTICYFQKMIVEENRECTIHFYIFQAQRKASVLLFPANINEVISMFILLLMSYSHYLP